MVTPRFEFATAAQIVFGRGTARQLGALARPWGTRALVVTGRTGRHFETLRADLAQAGVAVTRFVVAGEPEIATVERGIVAARQAGCDLVIGLGGGSALDAAKAIAGLLTNPGALLDYLEVVGATRPVPGPGAPFLAVPTTAGTGAEVTRNAVLASPEHRVKVSLRSPHLLARVVVVDPALTDDLPPALTASTGMDALTQLIESFLSPRANPLTDAFCREAIPRAARSLPLACHEGSRTAARDDLCVASLCSGLALANAGLGAVHGLAGPIGGMFPAPHGAVCAALLPHVLAANLRALQTRAADHPAVARFTELAQLLTGRSAAMAADGVEWVRALVRDMPIAPLSAYGLTRADVPAIVEKGLRASSMKSNPIALTTEELVEAMQAAL